MSEAFKLRYHETFGHSTNLLTTKVSTNILALATWEQVCYKESRRGEHKETVHHSGRRGHVSLREERREVQSMFIIPGCHGRG